MTTSKKDHFAVFPYPAHGHLLPMVDLAKMLAIRGSRISIIVTEGWVPITSNSIRKSQSAGFHLQILTIKFPPPDAVANFSQSLKDSHMLRAPLEQLLKEHRPDCVIADPFYDWPDDVAAKLGIPVWGLLGTGFFSMSVFASLQIHKPHENVSSDLEPFLVPVPGNITISKAQMVNSSIAEKMTIAISRYKGVLLNTFKELEPVYAEFYTNIVGKKAWPIGPLSFINKEAEDKLLRGTANANAMGSELIEWLDGKAPNSTVYLSFGSFARLKDCQLREIAMALEHCGYGFIWVVRTPSGEEQWLPEGFRKKMAGKGLIIRGWAPQVAILEHPSVGAFVTHCGWNSVLEGIMSGKPMVTWPVAAEQFYNEKLLVDVLKIGEGVGCRKKCLMHGDEVKREAIVRAVLRVMDGEEAEQMRERAIALRKLGEEAWGKNGTSHENVAHFISEFHRMEKLTG